MIIGNKEVKKQEAKNIITDYMNNEHKTNKEKILTEFIQQLTKKQLETLIDLCVEYGDYECITEAITREIGEF